MTLMTVLVTAGLLLRQIDRDDAAVLFRVFGDPEVMRYGDGAQTEAWVRQWIDWVHRGYDDMGYGPLAVVEKSSGQGIGYCGLFYFANINGRSEIEIGYRLQRSSWGRGYATEAGTAVRDHAFNTLGITRLVSLIDPANTASLAVARKLSMSYEADVMLAGYTHPDHLYVIEHYPAN